VGVDSALALLPSGHLARGFPRCRPTRRPAPPVPDDGVVESIGGYRLVRRIGSGERAEVFLGHVDGAPGGRSAAIKVYRASTPLASIEAEIAAVGRACSRHLVRLDDLATAPDGLPALLLGRLRPVTLARLIAARGRIELGEAVTVIAPLAGAVAELHRVGVSHGRIGPGSVLFDDTGAPVLASFGRAAVVGLAPGSPPAASMAPAGLVPRQQLARDLVDLAALARSVLTHTTSAPGRDAALAWLARTDPTSDPHRFATRLAEVMFEMAPATRILAPGSAGARDDGGRGADAAGIRPAGPAGAASPELAEFGVRPRGRRRRNERPVWLAALHLPDWVEELWPRAPRPRPRRALSLLARWLAPVRRPVWVGAATVAALLVAALVLAPMEGGAARPDSSPRPDASAQSEAPAASEFTAADATAAPAPDAAAPPGLSAAPGGDHHPEAPGGGGAGASAIAGDDPVPAVRALLDLRRHCLDSESVLCLDGVHQAGSAAWEADSHHVRRSQEGAGQEGAPPVTPVPDPADGQAAALVERIGNSALVTLPAPAGGAASISVLLIKSDVGWRIRDLFAG